MGKLRSSAPALSAVTSIAPEAPHPYSKPHPLNIDSWDVGMGERSSARRRGLTRTIRLSLLLSLLLCSCAFSFTPARPVFTTSYLEPQKTSTRCFSSVLPSILIPTNGTSSSPSAPPPILPPELLKYDLRQTPYSSLPSAASLLVNSFYPPSPLKPAYTLKEVRKHKGAAAQQVCVMASDRPL